MFGREKRRAPDHLTFAVSCNGRLSPQTYSDLSGIIGRELGLEKEPVFDYPNNGDPRVKKVVMDRPGRKIFVGVFQDGNAPDTATVRISQHSTDRPRRIAIAPGDEAAEVYRGLREYFLGRDK